MTLDVPVRVAEGDLVILDGTAYRIAGLDRDDNVHVQLSHSGLTDEGLSDTELAQRISDAEHVTFCR